MPARVTRPTVLSTGNNMKHSMGCHSHKRSDTLTHHEHTLHRYVFQNANKIDTVYNLNNLNWQSIHNSITTEKNRELFNTDFIVQGTHDNEHVTKININVNKNCMTEMLLLDNTKVLSLFDTGSTVNLISEYFIKGSVYLSSLPIMKCPDFRICNTSDEMIVNRFIELCFRLKDDYILHTTVLVVPDFGSVKVTMESKFVVPNCTETIK